MFAIDYKGWIQITEVTETENWLHERSMLLWIQMNFKKQFWFMIKIKKKTHTRQRMIKKQDHQNSKVKEKKTAICCNSWWVLIVEDQHKTNQVLFPNQRTWNQNSTQKQVQNTPHKKIQNFNIETNEKPLTYDKNTLTSTIGSQFSILN